MLPPPETGSPSMGTLNPANVAQKADETLRRDPLIFRHLERRGPLFRRLRVQARQRGVDQDQRQGGAGRDRALSITSKFALRFLAPPLPFPAVHYQICLLKYSVLIFPAKAGLVGRGS